jgi:hypothetical protein
MGKALGGKAYDCIYNDHDNNDHDYNVRNRR